MGELLVFHKLWLDAPCPLRLGIGLRLFQPRRTVPLRISPARRDDALVHRTVIWPRQVNVWCRVGVVIWLDAGDDNLLQSEVRLANARSVFVAIGERRWTSEQNRQDRVPRQKSVAEMVSMGREEEWCFQQQAEGGLHTWP